MARSAGMTNDTVLEFVDGYPELTTTAQTGNGSLVLSNSPTMTNPNLGDATATSLTLGSGVTLGNSSALAQFFVTPTAGQLVCIKAVGPPIQLGTSTEVSGLGAKCVIEGVRAGNGTDLLGRHVGDGVNRDAGGRTAADKPLQVGTPLVWTSFRSTARESLPVGLALVAMRRTKLFGR
jgi:hypothetical protein